MAAELQMRMLATGSDKIANIERQIRTPLVVNGQTNLYYICDFFVPYADGRKELIRIEGYVKPEFRLKKKLLAATFLLDAEI